MRLTQTCHLYRFNRNHSDFLWKFGPFPIFPMFRKYSNFFCELSFHLPWKNKYGQYSYNISILFFLLYIIKCHIEIDINILVVNAPNIDSVEFIHLRNRLSIFTSRPPLFPTKDFSYFIFLE